MEETSDGLTKIDFRNDVYFTGASLPVVAGIQAGIFEEHGLDVTAKEGKGSATTVQTVGNGSDDIGYADAGALVQVGAKGVPAKMFYGQILRSPLAVIAKKDSGISSPDDLAGKSASYTSGSAAEQLFPAFLEAVDISGDDIDLKNVDVPTRSQIFLADKVDFTFGLTNTSVPKLLEACDCELEVMPYRDYSVDTLSSGFIASDEMVEDHPETLQKFADALDESVKKTNEDPEWAIEQFFEYAPDASTPKEVLVKQWEETYKLSIPEGVSEDEATPGCMDDAQWSKTIELMEKYAGVKNGALDASDMNGDQAIDRQCE